MTDGDERTYRGSWESDGPRKTAQSFRGPAKRPDGHVSQSKHRSSDQRNDYRAVVNIGAGLEGVVPMIENLRHVAKEAKRQN